MKKFVWILGLGLALGGLGACGDDLGTPKADGGSGDGGKSSSDGGATDDGHASTDGGNKSEAGPSDVGSSDLSAAVEVGIGDVGSAADVVNSPDGPADAVSHVPSVDAAIPDAAIPDAASRDAATRDAASLDAVIILDVPAASDAAVDSASHEVGTDGGGAETGSAVEVGSDSLDGIDTLVQASVFPLTGQRFSPALPNASSLPSGTWYCDMGTVHWAQGEKGNGTCPICGMDLVQKA